ncbi:MAG: HIT domain-containing protein [Alphaproteobacteria bacterium]|nr:HIT domain-containing protein [Alphaproteobacteria bacterium]
MSDSNALPPWEDLIAGKGCPFCPPRPDDNEFWLKVASLSAATLYIDRNQAYRGYCLLVFDKRHVTGLEQLDEDEHRALTTDLRRAALAISKAVSPDMMNYASLGNVIPHLHFHLIPRYENDPRWGGPIWTTKLEDMQCVTPEESDLRALAQEIAGNLQE